MSDFAFCSSSLRLSALRVITNKSRSRHSERTSGGDGFHVLGHVTQSVTPCITTRSVGTIMSDKTIPPGEVGSTDSVVLSASAGVVWWPSRSSSPREPPPEALTEPDVKLSPHPALIIQSEQHIYQCANSLGCLLLKAVTRFTACALVFSDLYFRFAQRLSFWSKWCRI